MGDPILQLLMAVILACWAIAGYAIWKWGPGLRKRWVRCPEKKVRATVLADQREAEFGCLRVVDVMACSLFSGKPLSCGKECLTHL
jgi:hypothetical protein